MQNEALVALAIASAVDIGKEEFYLFICYLFIRLELCVYNYLHTCTYTQPVYVWPVSTRSQIWEQNSSYNQYTVGLVEPGNKHVSPLLLFSPESMKAPFKEAELLPMLQKMLEDPVAAVEVKFSALGLICSLAQSGTATGKTLLQYKTPNAALISYLKVYC